MTVGLTGVGLFALFLFAAVFLGADRLPFWHQVVLVVAGGVVCLQVGAHVERT